MKFLPAVSPRALSVCLAMLSAALALAGTLSLILVSESWAWAVAAVAVFFPLAWGVWRVNFYAIYLARILLWLAVVGIVFGTIDAFEAMEWREPPTPTWLLVHQVFPVAVPALAVLYVVSRYRASWATEPGA